MEKDIGAGTWFNVRKTRSMPCLHDPTIIELREPTEKSKHIPRTKAVVNINKIADKYEMRSKVNMKDYSLPCSDDESIFYEEPEPTLRTPQSLLYDDLSSFENLNFLHPNNVGFSKCFEFINAQCERGNVPQVVINKMSQVYECNDKIYKNAKAIKMSRIHYTKKKLFKDIDELQRKKDILIESFCNFLGWGMEGITIKKKQCCIYETPTNIQKNTIKKNQLKLKGEQIRKEYDKKNGLSTNGYQHFSKYMLHCGLNIGFVCELMIATKQNEYIKDFIDDESYSAHEVSKQFTDNSTDNSTDNVTVKDVIAQIYKKLEDEIYFFRQEYEQKYQEFKYLKKMNMKTSSSVNYYGINSIFIFSNYPAFSFLSVVEPEKSDFKMRDMLKKIIEFYEGLGVELEVSTESSETMRYADSISIKFYDKEKKACVGRLANATNYLLTTNLTSKKIPYIIYGYVTLLV